MIRIRRTAVAVIGAAAAGAVAFASPAAADVTVTPSEAERGGPAKVVFYVPEERPGAYTTKVELQMPVETPIAEVYPMSVDDWAPLSVSRELDQEIEGMHGIGTSQAISSITWTRAEDSGTSPAALIVSMGPMPRTDRVVLTMIQTYSDGTVVRWADPPAADGAAPPAHPAPVITLVGDAVAGAHHGGAEPVDAVPVASTRNAGEEQGAYGILGAGLLLGLSIGLLVAGWFAVRARRTPAPVPATAEAVPTAAPTDSAS